MHFDRKRFSRTHPNGESSKVLIGSRVVLSCIYCMSNVTLTKIILNVMLAGFDAADGDPPRAKKAEGRNCFAIFGLSDGKR